VTSFTLREALVHLYFSGLPIDLGVVVLEPSVAEDHALLSKAGDSEECPFGVGLVMENYVYHFGDLPCFVGGAVHIVHWYGARDALGANTLCTDKIFIYEATHSSGVQKHLDRVYLAGIGGTDLDREDNEHSMGIESVGRESFGESLFPFGSLRQGFPDRSGGGDVTIGSQLSVLTSSTFNTANLFTDSDQGILFASHTKQNPPWGQSILPLPLLHLSEPSSLQLISLFAPWLTFGHPNDGGSPS